MALTNAEFAPALAAAIDDFHNSVTDEAGLSTALLAILNEWALGGVAVARAAAVATESITGLNVFVDEMREWAAGTADGGPNSDGLYPITNPAGGDPAMIPSPAAIAVSGLSKDGSNADAGILANLPYDDGGTSSTPVNLQAFNRLQPVLPEAYGAVGDNVATDTAAIQATIANALLTGRPIYGAGTYLVDSATNLANFWDVKWIGPGGIRKGGSTWKFEPRLGDAVNTLYCDADDGDNANDGLHPGTRFAHPDRAIACFKLMPPVTGQLGITSGACTYTARMTIDVPTLQPILIQGPDVSGGVPTVIFDMDGLGLNSAVRGEAHTRAIVKNIKVINARGTLNSGGAFEFPHQTYVELHNCHVDGCNGSGVYVSNLSRGYVYGGIYEDCFYNIEFYGESQGSIGQDGDAPSSIAGATTDACVAIRRNSHVKINSLNIDGAGISGVRGLFVNDQSTTHWVAGEAKQCTYAVFAFPNAYALIESAIEFYKGDATDQNGQLFYAGPCSNIDYGSTNSGFRTEKEIYRSNSTVTHTGTTTTTDLATIATVPGDDFNLARSYKVEVAGTLTGTASGKSIRLRQTGGGVQGAVVNFPSTYAGRFECTIEIQATSAGNYVSVGKGSVEGHGNINRRATPTGAWTSDGSISVAATLGNAADTVQIDWIRGFVSGV